MVVKQEDELVDAPEHPAKQEEPLLRAEKIYLGAWLFGTITLILLSSVWTNSPVILTFIGFLALLVSILLLFITIEQGFKDVVYWFIPFLTSFVFLALGSLINPLLQFQLNVGALSVVNLVFGLVMVLGLIIIEGKGLFEQKSTVQDDITIEQELGEYLHSIEDKCKALNFVIGRVYRKSNGGSDSMRAKLRIDSEWYNQFNSFTKDIDENRLEALAVLDLIHERLSLFVKKEKDVFEEQEIKSLKHLARNKEGEEKIIDILIKNDQDPVESYYVGAVDATRKLIEALKE